MCLRNSVWRDCQRFSTPAHFSGKSTPFNLCLIKRELLSFLGARMKCSLDPRLIRILFAECSCAVDSIRFVAVASKSSARAQAGTANALVGCLQPGGVCSGVPLLKTDQLSANLFTPLYSQLHSQLRNQLPKSAQDAPARRRRGVVRPEARLSPTLLTSEISVSFISFCY